MEKKQSEKVNTIYYIGVAIVLILLYLYLTKPTQNITVQSNSTTQSNSGYASTISQLQSTNQNLNSQLQQIENNQKNPYVREVYPNQTIIVPAINSSATVTFYNSTYNLYNNYTSDGVYNLSFKEPYDGYLIVYIKSVNAVPGTWGFNVNSNSSDYEYYFTNPYVITIPSQSQNYEPLKPTASFSVVPDRNTSFYQIMPILRGKDNFSFDNANNYPIDINFSIVYVGENYSNLTPVSINYT